MVIVPIYGMIIGVKLRLLFTTLQILQLTLKNLVFFLDLRLLCQLFKLAN